MNPLSWRTTVFGLITALAGWVVFSPEIFQQWPWVVSLAKYIMLGGIASTGLAAKDSNPALTTFTWSASGLPSGLRINSTTGAITGKTGTSARTYTVRITARDANGASGSVSFSWVVN